MILQLAFLIMTDYFSDLEFIDGAIVPECRARLKDHVAAAYSLEFIRSGRLLLERGHGPSVILDEPGLFWHRPDRHYDYGACDDEGWYHHWFTFRGARAKRLIEGAFQALSPNGYVYVNNPAIVGRLFERIITQMHRRTKAGQALAVSMVEELLAAMMDDQVLPDHELAFKQALDDLCRRIQDHPEWPFDFEEEARRMNSSYSHFRRRFRRFVGRAPHEYLVMARMYKAARKLRIPQLPVKLIAAQVGYDDPAQFSRIFKRSMGLPPKEYKAGMPGYQLADEMPLRHSPIDE
jgi:AraC-like DNA-binding protein